MILNNEIAYTVSELEKRKKSSKKFDLNGQLTNNTFIFKENLKEISLSISKVKSRLNLEGKIKSKQN